jgi:DNA topoisomerase-3
VILQRPIEPEQLQKLLATGKTDLLHRFISRKGRPFSAFLVKGPDGKVGFEFAPRAPKAAQKGPSVSAPGRKEKAGGKAEAPPRSKGTRRSRVVRNRKAA